MDTGLTLKPAASLAQMGDMRTDPTARSAAPTELAPAKTVTPASDSEPTPATDDQRARKIILDPHSREVIYRVVDVRSGRVVRQVPEEAMLRLKAYARETLDRKSGDKALDTTA